MEEEIFYPNKLTPDEINNLSGWKLKVAVLHFGKTRHDCVELGYGYQLLQKAFDNEPQIYLVADKDEIYNRAISLECEIDWDDWADIFVETGQTITEYFKKYVAEKI